MGFNPEEAAEFFRGIIRRMANSLAGLANIGLKDEDFDILKDCTSHIPNFEWGEDQNKFSTGDKDTRREYNLADKDATKAHEAQEELIRVLKENGLGEIADSFCKKRALDPDVVKAAMKERKASIKRLTDNFGREPPSNHPTTTEEIKSTSFLGSTMFKVAMALAVGGGASYGIFSMVAQNQKGCWLVDKDDNFIYLINTIGNDCSPASRAECACGNRKVKEACGFKCTTTHSNTVTVTGTQTCPKSSSCFCTEWRVAYRCPSFWDVIMDVFSGLGKIIDKFLNVVDAGIDGLKGFMKILPEILLYGAGGLCILGLGYVVVKKIAGGKSSGKKVAPSYKLIADTT